MRTRTSALAIRPTTLTSAAVSRTPERSSPGAGRQSISKSLDYTRGVASQHNSWLQTKRWDSQIEALMAAVDKSVPQEHAPAPTLRPDPEFLLSRANLRRATAA